jgi:alpha-glucosidase
MAADLPENYARYPEPFQFIRDVPVDWAETTVVAGEVGDFAVIARKDRNSEDWYLGAVTDENARALKVPLDFLDAGRTYRAEIYRDGDEADWKTRPHAIVVERRDARREDAWPLRLAPGGGFAIRFVALPAVSPAP